MAGYNTSSAYDFSKFETGQKKQTSSPKLRVVKNRRHIAPDILSPSVICAFVIVVVLVSLMVYNQLQLNVLSSEIHALEKEMETLHSENVRMQSILDSSISTTELKQLAAAMGMQKRDEYQTTRIYLYQEDKIERSEAALKPSSSEMAKLAITSLFGRFKEYLADR